MKPELSATEKDVIACARYWLSHVDEHGYFTLPMDEAKKVLASIVALGSRCSNEIRGDFPLPGEDPIEFVQRLDTEYRRITACIAVLDRQENPPRILSDT